MPAVVQAGLVAAGGFAGGWARHVVGGLLPGGGLGAGILAINTTGAFLLALWLTAVPPRTAATARARLLVGTGFCGSFTTFSTVVADTARAGAGSPWHASAGVAAAVVAGLAAAVAGMSLGRSVRGRRAAHRPGTDPADPTRGDDAP